MAQASLDGTCPPEEDIAAFVDGCLAAPQRSAVEVHVAGCDACRRLLSALARAAGTESQSGRDSVAPTLPLAWRTSDAESPPGARLPEPDVDRVLVPGMQIGRYVVVHEIGAGAMGVVHAAFDPDLQRRIALKVLRGANVTPNARERLLREARAMARLSHPNVVTVYEVGTAAGRDFVAMELIHGETLADWLRASPRSPAAIVDVFVAAGRGLAAAHAAGIIHRDFKPRNVLRSRDGRIAVTDFGLARDTDGELPPALDDTPPVGPASRPRSERPELTVTGALLGTPAYMPPEQWRGDAITPEADQFAYCVALWEALSGERPYRGPNVDELRRQIMAGPAGLDASRIPHRLRGLLRRGLDPDPARRWPSMNALLEQLARMQRVQVRDGSDAAELILAAVPRSELVDVPCPYPGMRPFAADDANNFHGRNAEIAELISRLQAGDREIFVIGPSGSGKSSLVKAGVLPRLARGVTGLGPFVVRELRPGEQPAARLGEALEVPAGEPLVVADRTAALLAHRGSSASLLIVVDQLEELYTLTSADERARFLEALRALRAERRCVVVFTLRADFFGALMESTLWTECRGQLSRVEVSPLRDEALREAIAAPAGAVGVTVEPELIERLVADAASEPGILPLLQETLVQLWDARTDQTLTLPGYEALGDGERSGLAVALARRADATLRRFNPAQTDIARRSLLRLISFGEGRSDTRRQQPRVQLCAAGEDAADFHFVLQTMVDDRLLTVDDDVAGEPRVDLAHEIMISAWRTLAGWIQAHRMDEQRRREYEAAAARWTGHGRGARGLLDPVELADADKWQRTESAVQLGQSAEVVAFITASRAAQTRQRRRRRAVLAGSFAMLAGGIAVVAALAITARHRANDAQHLLAQSYAEAGRQQLVAGHPQEATPYLLAARQNGEEGAPLRMMFWASTRQSSLVPGLKHKGQVRDVAFSPDGTRVVTASADRTARVWDAATGKPVTGSLEHQGEVMSVAFSPDGTRVVTGSWDKTARVWDAATGKLLTKLLISVQGQCAVRGAAFSPDGTRVVTASDDGTARVWDAATGKLLTEMLASPLQEQHWVNSAAFSPDGTRVVTASNDGTVRVWDAATGKLLTEMLTSPLQHQVLMTSAAFSPDGTRVVTASDDGTARVWEATTGKPITSPLEHQGRVNSAAFSPDGTRVVTASGDTARVWEATTGKPITSFEHESDVESAGFSPDGTRVVTASADMTARVWDAATGKPITGLLKHQEYVGRARFSPDGTRVVTASADMTAQVWDAATGNPISNRLQPQSAVRSAAFSPDGTRMITTSGSNAVQVWDVATGKPLTSLLQHQSVVRSAGFSPDGTRVVTASADMTVRVWDAATGNPITSPLQHQGLVMSAVFSSDGTRMVTTSGSKTAQVWDVATGKPLTSLQHESVVRSAAFSPDGTRVVTASHESAQVWDAATGKPLLTSSYSYDGPLKHESAVVSAAFSPDGTRVVTASWDDTARVWDAATGKPLTSPLEHQGVVVSATFSPDGTRVVTASADTTARVWDAATGKPLISPLEHQDEVVSAAFSPDGTRVVTASHDKTARVWDAATGKLLLSPFEHDGAVISAAFSPDGTRVVTASDDKTGYVWDVRLDDGTLEQWSTIADRSPFLLSGIALLRRTPSGQKPKFAN